MATSTQRKQDPPLWLLIQQPKAENTPRLRLKDSLGFLLFSQFVLAGAVQDSDVWVRCCQEPASTNQERRGTVTFGHLTPGLQWAT